MFSHLSNSGFAFELPVYIDRLMRSKDEDAFLTIQVAQSEDFLQLTGDNNGVQLDFPMITSRQRGYEKKIRSAAASANLVVVENHGSDGALFLDIDLEGPSQMIAAVCSRMLREIFSVGDDTGLIFQHVGLAPDTAA